MRNATLRQLRVFECVARHLNFSRAAEELHLTQPAVSTAVSQLESHTGLALFEHLGHRVFLTEAGKVTLASARAIIQQVRETEEALASLGGAAGGTLNVAVISAGNYFFPGLLAAFKKHQPNVAVTLMVNNRDQLWRNLADNIIDIAIMGRPPKDADLISAPFAPHPYAVIAPPDHPLVGKKRVAWGKLIGERMIVRERGSDNRATFDETNAEMKSKVPVTMEIASNETIKQSVIAGMGLGFLSMHTIAPEYELNRLAIIDIIGFPVVRHWHVVHHRQKRLPPVAEAFTRFLHAEGAGLIEKLVHVPNIARSKRKSTR
ncbi:MAG: LysR family transcriptional regulator [Betaproteobacteria bacterium]|nr:LysR family transcriptional regulator [Betaproteobacteria bacterium]